MRSFGRRAIASLVTSQAENARSRVFGYRLDASMTLRNLQTRESARRVNSEEKTNAQS
jgi:hypothetical protein